MRGPFPLIFSPSPLLLAVEIAGSSPDPGVRGQPELMPGRWRGGTPCLQYPPLGFYLDAAALGPDALPLLLYNSGWLFSFRRFPLTKSTGTKATAGGSSSPQWPGRGSGAAARRPSDLVICRFKVTNTGAGPRPPAPAPWEGRLQACSRPGV